MAGPTSKAGKATVSRNALKHGLRASRWLSPEEQVDFDSLMQGLYSEYKPETTTEHLMIERIAMGMSKLRRLQRVEDAMYAKARFDVAHPIVPNSRPGNTEMNLDRAMPSIKTLDTLARYQTALDRQVSKAIGELMIIKDRNKLPASLPSPTTVKQAQVP